MLAISGSNSFGAYLFSTLEETRFLAEH